MNENNRFYLKMSAILSIAFFIWYFGLPEKNDDLAENISETSFRDKPAALENFVPPTLIIFKDSENVLPKRNWSTLPLELQAETAIAIKLDGSRIYYNKNMNNRRPIASLTKLMTAIIVLENYDLNDVIKISRNNVESEGSRDDLRFDEKITVRSLLSIMLINSSNNAALALANKSADFISLMNKKVKNLGLSNTHFANSDGVDNEKNYSSAFDIAKIFGYIINNHPEILDILKTKNMVVYSSDGKIEHRIENTNEFLGKLSGVVAGKTGYTDKAGGSLILLISDFNFGNKNNIITVVLGSTVRFRESEKLIQWLREAYIWQ